MHCDVGLAVCEISVACWVGYNVVILWRYVPVRRDMNCGMCTWLKLCWDGGMVWYINISLCLFV